MTDVLCAFAASAGKPSGALRPQILAAEAELKRTGTVAQSRNPFLIRMGELVQKFPEWPQPDVMTDLFTTCPAQAVPTLEDWLVRHLPWKHSDFVVTTLFERTKLAAQHGYSAFAYRALQNKAVNKKAREAFELDGDVELCAKASDPEFRFFLFRFYVSFNNPGVLGALAKADPGYFAANASQIKSISREWYAEAVLACAAARGDKATALLHSPLFAWSVVAERALQSPYPKSIEFVLRHNSTLSRDLRKKLEKRARAKKSSHYGYHRLGFGLFG